MGLVKNQDVLSARNNLARLLATERLLIRHQNVATASFDTVRRILTLPNWTHVSENVFTMLNAHEVGHAKFTPTNWYKLADKIDPKNSSLARAYVNIICDARIERLMKESFAGLSYFFAEGYSELFKDDFFGVTTDNDANSRSFIDRINLHFKIGAFLRIRFSPAERKLVNKVAKTLTFDDVLAVTKEIYQFSKQVQPQCSPDMSATGDQPGEPGEESGSGSGEAQSEDKGDSGKAGGEDGNDGEGTGDQNEDSDSGGEGEVKPGKSEPDTGENQTVPSKTDQTGQNSERGPAAPTTQSAFDNRLANKIDKHTKIVYVRPPQPNPGKIIEDYPQTHAAIRRKLSVGQAAAAEACFDQFRKFTTRKVSFIVQQFEMRKQADRYKRQKRHKTGSLDVLRLHEYKYADDLFKSVSVALEGKNHGLVFIIDWSASMQGNMPATIKQLIVLCMFCRKANIPFEVHALTNFGANAFVREPETFRFLESFKLINLLSSRMTQPEFHDACVNLFSAMVNDRWSPNVRELQLCYCTPLDEAVAATLGVVEEFRKATKTQILNAVFLTDGDANTVSAYYDSDMKSQHMNRSEKYIMEDPKTHRVYEFRPQNLTPSLLQLLGDRGDINVVGFYVGAGSDWRDFFTERSDAEMAQLATQYKTDGYLISKDWGYKELYLVDAIEQPKDDKADTVEGLVKESLTHGKERLMLTSFVKMIA